MINIIRPDLSELPLLDTELLYVNPSYALNPISYDRLANSINVDIFNQIRFGYFVGLSCCHPRFDTEQYFYKMKTNPVYQILPDKNPVYQPFDIITDRRAFQLKQTAERYEKIYLFWSGGMDSTTVLTAVLKNWDTASLSKLVVVLNKHSIAEHPNMYNTLIRNKLNEVSTDAFFTGAIKLNNNSLYVTGDLGDPLFGYDGIYEFDKKYPGLYKQPWRKHIDKLIEHFSVDGPVAGEFTMTHIMESMSRNSVSIDTVYDLLWWINFNWGHDLDLYFLLWQFSALPGDVDPKKFMEENVFLFFNSKDHQNWGITTIGTNLKIGDSAATHKLAAKKYIYEFDHDSAYFDNKLKEDSTSKNPGWHTNKRLFAIDTAYNLYYIEPSIWLSK